MDGVRYPLGAGCLWHWLPAEEDASVRAVAASYADSTLDERDRFRLLLTAEAVDTVLVYARRMSLWALRTGLHEVVAAGMRALALIDFDRVDWEDISITCAQLCFAGERIGMSLAEVVAVAAEAAALAEPRVGAMLAEHAMERIDLGDAVGEWEVPTRDGPVFIHDFGESYDPRADLVAAALALAGFMDTDQYWVTGIYAGTTLNAWVGADKDVAVGAACERITGCVSIHAGMREPAPTRRRLLSFVAEAASPGDAELLASAGSAGTSDDTVICGLAVGRLVGLVIASTRTRHVPPPEDAASLQRFLDATRTALGAISD